MSKLLTLTAAVFHTLLLFSQGVNKRFAVGGVATLQESGGVLIYDNFHILFGSNHNPQYMNGLKTYLLKVNANGDFIDSVFISIPQRRQVMPRSSHGYKNADGSFLFAGVSLATDGEVRVLLVKADTNLQLHFVKEYEWAGNQVFIGKAIQHYDDGYLITGHIQYANYDADVFLLKTDSAGNELWRQSYGASHLLDFGYNVLPLPDGNILLSGFSENRNPVGGLVYPRTYLIETDSLGNPLWEWRDPDTSTLGAFAFIPTQDGGFVGVGAYVTFRSQWDGFKKKAYWVRFDVNKQKVAEKTYGFQTGHSMFNDVVELPDGNFLVCGALGIDISEQYNRHGNICKLTPSGDTIWCKSFIGVNSAPQCCSDNMLYDLEVLPGGSIMATGQADDNTGTNGYPQQQGWLLHIDSNGCLLPTSCGITAVEQTPSPSGRDGEGQVKCYPNPVSTQLTIEYSLPNNVKNASLVISDLNGRVVYSNALTLPQYLYNIDVTVWVDGVYYYQIVNSSTSVASGKIVVIK